MIVSGILEDIFLGMTLTYDEYSSDLVTKKSITKEVMFDCGDDKELAKWVHGRNGKQKYPLIWNLIEKVGNSADGEILKPKNCCLILFTSTKPEYYNRTRRLINYKNILHPLSIAVIRKIEESGKLNFVYNDFESVYTTFDVPNYGVDLDDFGFTSNLSKGTKAITVDVVDARKIEFTARFNMGNASNC